MFKLAFLLLFTLSYSVHGFPQGQISDGTTQPSMMNQNGQDSDNGEVTTKATNGNDMTNEVQNDAVETRPMTRPGDLVRPFRPVEEDLSRPFQPRPNTQRRPRQRSPERPIEEQALDRPQNDIMPMRPLTQNRIRPQQLNQRGTTNGRPSNGRVENTRPQFTSLENNRIANSNNERQPRQYDGDVTEEAYMPLNYQYEYNVNQEDYNNYYGHRESGQGRRVEGTYYNWLPDGRLMRVDYYVDGNSGFRPTITYIDDYQPQWGSAYFTDQK